MLLTSFSLTLDIITWPVPFVISFLVGTHFSLPAIDNAPRTALTLERLGRSF